MSDVDDIKAKLNIVDVVGKRVKLSKAGRNFKALCPFHTEKTPSFMVSAERQTFKCFGCGKGGSVFDFVMEYDHIDFVEALEQLAQVAGVTLARRPADTPQAKLRERMYEVNHLASEYYHYILTKHTLGKKAMLYLKNRGITDKSIKTFGLGYSPNSWEGLLGYLTKKGYDGVLLEQAGLIIPGRRSTPAARNHYYDRFRGRVMFTLRDHRGNVIGFAGRTMDPKAKEAKYINTSETPVYIKSNTLYGLDVTKDAISKAGEAVVMEGELDVISSFQQGISNVVAIKGSALTEGHVRLLKRFTDRLVFALDSDMAGDAAARRGIEIAERAGFDMRVVQLPEGKDPDDVARANPTALKKAIKEAIPIYDYFIASAVARHSADTVYGKKKVAEELLPELVKIENPIVQGHYVRKLASTLGVTEQTVIDGVVKASRNSSSYARNTSKMKETGKATTRREKLEALILSYILQGETRIWWEEFRTDCAVSDISLPPVRRVLTALETYLASHDAFDIKSFAASLPKELLPALDDAFLWDIADILADDRRAYQQWRSVLIEFRKAKLHTDITELTKRTSASTEQNDDEVSDSLKSLTEQLAQLEKQD